MRTFRTHMQSIEVIDSITGDLCNGVFHEEATLLLLLKSCVTPYYTIHKECLNE